MFVFVFFCWMKFKMMVVFVGCFVVVGLLFSIGGMFFWLFMVVGGVVV